MNSIRAVMIRGGAEPIEGAGLCTGYILVLSATERVCIRSGE